MADTDRIEALRPTAYADTRGTRDSTSPASIDVGYT